MPATASYGQEPPYENFSCTQSRKYCTCLRILLMLIILYVITATVQANNMIASTPKSGRSSPIHRSSRKRLLCEDTIDISRGGTSDEASDNKDKVLPKKRKRMDENRKRNKAKKAVNSGTSGVSITKEQIKAKILNPPCTFQCKFKCGKKIFHEDRKFIFKNFWKIPTKELKWAYVARFVKTVQVEKNIAADKPRLKPHKFELGVKNDRIKVCSKMFFTAHLGLRIGGLKQLMRS